MKTNSKKDKEHLINSILKGEIDPKNLSSEPIIVSKGNEAFKGIMLSVATKKKGKQNPVVFVGQAKTMIDEILNNIKEKRNGTAKAEQESKD